MLCVDSGCRVPGRRDDTGLFVGYVPGFPGAHSQGESKEELRANLEEVVAMLLEDGEPPREAEFVGTETIRVACAQIRMSTNSTES